MMNSTRCVLLIGDCLKRGAQPGLAGFDRADITGPIKRPDLGEPGLESTPMLCERAPGVPQLITKSGPPDWGSREAIKSVEDTDADNTPKSAKPRRQTRQHAR